MSGIVTPSMKLCSLADFKDFTKMASTSANDTLLNTLIDRASMLIERACRRKFKSQAYTAEIYDGNGDTWMYLRNAPVTAVSTIHTRAAATWTAETDVSTYLDYGDTDEQGFIFWMDGREFPEGTRNIKITYTAGYATAPDSLPEVIQQAAIEMTQLLWFRREHLQHIIPSLTMIDGGTIVFRDKPIPDSVQAVINDYKLYGYGFTP